MKYHDSLWKNAPPEATHWGVDAAGIVKWFVSVGNGLYLSHPSGGRGIYDYASQVTDLHERPACYRSAEQLVRDLDVDFSNVPTETLMRATFENGVQDITVITLFARQALEIIDRLNAAERERIEKEQP